MTLYSIWIERSTTGCIMDDGADTRKSYFKYHVVGEEDKESFQEYCISCYEDQDYSYSVSFKCLIEEITDYELEALGFEIKTKLEDEQRREGDNNE